MSQENSSVQDSSLQDSSLNCFEKIGSDHLPITGEHIVSFNILSDSYLKYFKGSKLSSLIDDKTRVQKTLDEVLKLADSGKLVLLQEICNSFISLFKSQKKEWESKNSGYYKFYLNYNEKVMGDYEPSYVGYFYSREYFKTNFKYSDQLRDTRKIEVNGKGKKYYFGNYLTVKSSSKQAYAVVWENKKNNNSLFLTVTVHIPQRNPEYSRFEEKMNVLMSIADKLSSSNKMPFYFAGDFNTEKWDTRTFGIQGFNKINNESFSHFSGGGKLVSYDHILKK